jgi:hypothetical protein
VRWVAPVQHEHVAAPRLGSISSRWSRSLEAKPETWTSTGAFAQTSSSTLMSTCGQ